MSQQWREPQQLAQGDTINFVRTIPKYPPASGWNLLYALRGGAQPIEFQSAAQNNTHLVVVPAATTEAWIPGNYTLEGFAVNAGTGERHQVYLSQLVITPDLSSQPGDADDRTHAEKMLQYVEQQLEQLAQNSLDRTSVEGTEIQRVQRESLYRLRAKYIRERQGEIARMRAQSGLPNQRKLRGVMRIVQPGSPAPSVFQGPSVYNNPYP